MIDKLLAGIALSICVVLLARLVVGQRTRHRLDSFARRCWRMLQKTTQIARRWFATKRHEKSTTAAATRAAEAAIRQARDRAREQGTWDGNVYTPKSFRKPPHDEMH
jgi:hypothetical protein